MVDKLHFQSILHKTVIISCKTTQLFWRKGHCTMAEVRDCRNPWTKQYSEMGTALGAKQVNSGCEWPGGWGSHHDEVRSLHQLPAPPHTKFGRQELEHPKTSTCPGGQLFYYSSDAQSKLSWHQWGYANTSLPNSCHGDASANIETQPTMIM